MLAKQNQEDEEDREEALAFVTVSPSSLTCVELLLQDTESQGSSLPFNSSLVGVIVLR
jgi:hypothetical protein